MNPRTEVRRAYYETNPREMRLAVAGAEMRDAGGAAVSLRGYASITDTPYTVTDWLGDYTETISRGAFAKSLSEADDVRLLVNHDGVPLARTKSGTLALREIADPRDDPQGRGQTGLWSEASLDAASPLAQTVRSAMERGDLSEMSFAFQVTRQEWDGDYTERSISEVKLFDVSVVTYPANPATSVQLNSADLARVAGHLRAGRPMPPEDVETLTRAMGWLSAAAEARAHGEPDGDEPDGDEACCGCCGEACCECVDPECVGDCCEECPGKPPAAPADRSRALALTLARARR